MSGKAQKKLNSEVEILLEAAKVAEDLSELLQKSSKENPFKKKDESDEDKEEKAEEAPSEDKKEESEAPASEEAPAKEEGSESLEKEGDNIVGEVPESTEKSEEAPAAPAVDFASMSESDLLNFASQALEALESRGISEQASQDVEAAEHEINELKQEVPVEAVPVADQPIAPEAPAIPAEEAPAAPMEKEAAPVVEAPAAEAAPMAGSEPDLNSILGQRDINELMKFHQKLGEHLAARNEMEKTSAAPAPQVEKPEPAVAPAMAMMKSLEESMKKSFKESLDVIKTEFKASLEENKKLSSELAEMKKSFNQFKKDVDSMPMKKYASGSNAKENEKLLVKSILESIPEVEDVAAASSLLIKDILHHQRILAKSNTSPRIKLSDFIFKAEQATCIADVTAIRKELERNNIKL